MTDSLGSIGQRLSNALGRLQQADAVPAMRQAQTQHKTDPSPTNSILVNVKTNTSQASVNGNSVQEDSSYKSALGQRLSNSLARLKNENEQVDRMAEEGPSFSNSSSVEVKISRAARQILSDKLMSEDTI